jgi:hypothetical protein
MRCSPRSGQGRPPGDDRQRRGLPANFLPLRLRVIHGDGQITASPTAVGINGPIPRLLCGICWAKWRGGRFQRVRKRPMEVRSDSPAARTVVPWLCSGALARTPTCLTELPASTPGGTSSWSQTSARDRVSPPTTAVHRHHPAWYYQRHPAGWRRRPVAAARSAAHGGAGLALAARDASCPPWRLPPRADEAPTALPRRPRVLRSPSCSRRWSGSACPGLLGRGAGVPSACRGGAGQPPPSTSFFLPFSRQAPGIARCRRRGPPGPPGGAITGHRFHPGSPGTAGRALR